MNDRSQQLRELYDGMNTEALLELHEQADLTDDAYAVLESVLVERAVAVPARPVKASQPKTGKCTTRWALRFALIGLLIPIICMTLGFRPGVVLNLCELCWPTGFILLAADGHFDLVLFLISISINAAVWAGFGWVIGYALSDRTRP